MAKDLDSVGGVCDHNCSSNPCRFSLALPSERKKSKAIGHIYKE